MKQLFTLLLLLVLLTRPVLASDIIVQPMPASDMAAAPIAAADVQPSGAWIWSLVVPGLGQIVMGEPLWGLAFFTAPALGCVVTGAIIAEVVRENQPGRYGSHGALMIFGALAVSVLTAGCWALGVMDAHLLDLRRQREAAKRCLGPLPKD